jgi:hypothetical protein
MSYSTQARIIKRQREELGKLKIELKSAEEEAAFLYNFHVPQEPNPPRNKKPKPVVE